MTSTVTILTSPIPRRRSSSPRAQWGPLAAPPYVALRTATTETSVRPSRPTSESTIASRLLTIGQDGEEEVGDVSMLRQHHHPGLGDEDECRHSGACGAAPTTRSYVEFGLAWVPDGPFMYVTAASQCCGPDAATAAKEADAACTKIPAPLPVTVVMTSTTSSDDAAPRCGPPSLEIVHECDDDSYRSSEAVSTAAASGSDEGERRANDGDDDRHHRLRTSHHSVLVLLLHPTSNRYELLSVVPHEPCDVVRHTWKDYVEAAVRGATFTGWDEASENVGDRSCKPYLYSTFLRLLVEVVSSLTTTSTQIRVHTQRQSKCSRKESMRDDVESPSSVGQEVLVPLPHGKSTSWTIRRARKVLQQASDVVASALSRSQGVTTSVQGCDSLRVHDAPIVVPPRDGNDKVFGTERVCRADPSSPPASRIGRTPLGSRQASLDQKRKQFRPGRIRRYADPDDKENDC